MAIFSAYNLISRKLSAMGYTPLEIVVYGVTFGTLMLLYYLGRGIAEVSTATPTELLSLLFLGIFPSALAHFFWGVALSLAERTSEVTNYMLRRFFSTIFGFLLLKDVP